MELNKALMIAEEIVESLRPHCELINVAGSCRREKVEVKDIELVVVPKPRIIKDVFGEAMTAGRAKGFVVCVEALGERLKGSALDGRQVDIKLTQGLKLDLFIPDANEY
jgi:DNA polymerase/3'-5' exonuclease PolX